MKIGFILECGPEGADVKVCKHLVHKINAEIEFVSLALDVKPKLISGCGKAAKQLLASGCEKVFIIWDLFPKWRTGKPCRKEDREAIFEALNDAGVSHTTVNLVCIEQELESWLIADGRAISEFLSTETRKVAIKDTKNPDIAQNPKKILNQYFNKNKGRDYVDYQHAEKLVKLIPDFSKLRKSVTFRRFYYKLSGEEL